MTLPLVGEVAFVTGSSCGIGTAIATRLAADNASVVVNYLGSAASADTLVVNAGILGDVLLADIASRVPQARYVFPSWGRLELKIPSRAAAV